MGSVLDITERKRADELARQQSEKLQHTSRLVVMGEMASALAHELNQPLSAIASYATGCLNRLRAGDTAPGELTPALEKLGRQAQRAGHIIRRVHGFARKSEPRMEPCDVAAILEDCRELMHPDAARRGVRIAVDPVPDLPRIDADAIQIGQVLLNLARNGMEAMAQTPKDRRLLRMSAQAEDGSVLFSVTDRGPGIPPDVAAQLFTPFFTTKEEGMGMGLNICRSIVEHHRGRLWFETPPEGGCIFHFLLPAVKP
jgi:two-component system sensor histidine kinase DctS